MSELNYKCKYCEKSKPRDQMCTREGKVKAVCKPVSPPRWGLKAFIDDGFLRLEQADSEGNTDTLMISPAEWQQLQAKFGDWGR